MKEAFSFNLLLKENDYSSIIETRLDDEYYTMTSLLHENAFFLELAKKYNVKYMLIDEQYDIMIDGGINESKR